MGSRIKKTSIAIILSLVSTGSIAHGYVSLSKDGIVGRAALCNSSASENQDKNMNTMRIMEQ